MDDNINPRKFRPSRTVPLTSVDFSSGKPPELPFNKKVGHLKIGPNRPIGRGKKIYAVCDCGHADWYPTPLLEKMVKRRSGCGSKGCSALSFKEAVWESPDAIRMQLFALLLICPEDVQSFWGGTLDDVYDLSFEPAVENLYQYLNQRRQHGLWLTRENDKLPFIEGNVLIGRRPDKALNKFSKASIEVEGVRMSMKELCSIGNVSASTLLIKLYERGTTDDLLFHLMED